MSQARHEVRFPGESDAYRAARNELLEEEIALRRQAEAVAAKRRTLPLGGEVPEDYVFQEAVGDGVHDVRLSELFEDGKDTLREPGQDGRHMDMIWPLWNLLDLAPEGRGETWHPRLSY